MITKSQAKFVMSALCKDPTRFHLRLPYITGWQGRRWIFATDGHRMHALATTLKHEGYCYVTKDGDVHLLAPDSVGATYPPVAKVFPKEPVFHEVDGERLAATALIRSKVPGRACVRFERKNGSTSMRVGVWLQGDDAEGSVCVQPEYVAAALAEKPSHVEVAIDGPMDPVQIRPKSTSPAWQALIMPVRT